MFQSVLNAEAAVRKAAVLLRDQMPYIGPSPPPGFDEARGIYANMVSSTAKLTLASARTS